MRERGAWIRVSHAGALVTGSSTGIGAGIARMLAAEGAAVIVHGRDAARAVTPIPVGRIGRPEDIAHAIRMIASPAAGYITGANIRIDGGQVQSVN